jgi:hypothetical protein
VDMVSHIYHGHSVNDRLTRTGRRGGLTSEAGGRAGGRGGPGRWAGGRAHRQP